MHNADTQEILQIRWLANKLGLSPERAKVIVGLIFETGGRR